MVEGSNQMTPKTTVAVTSQSRLTESDRLVLDRLYEPILGVSAYSLVTSLWREIEFQPHQRIEVPHYHFLQILNIDLPTFETARKRLEAVGLLRSFHRRDQVLPEWLYQLELPVNSSLFFSDNLLSLLLLEIVGEQQFKALALAFRPEPVDHTGFQETTDQFLNVFKVDNRLIATPPAVIQEVQNSMGDVETSRAPATVTPDHDGFDFDLLTAILQRSYVEAADLSHHRDLILNEVALYGLTETEMASYITDATSLTTNKVDTRQLKLKIAADHRSAPRSQATPVSTAQSAKADTVTGLSQPEKSLVSLANRLSPMDFLTAIRTEQHGFVAANEQRIVERLDAQKVFGHPVLNILVFYLLNDMGKATLTQSLADTVANGWAQAGVTTAAEAIREIHRYRAKQNSPKKTPRRSASSNRRTVKETLPEWAKDDYQPTNGTGSKLSDEQRAKMAEQLKRLNAKNGGDVDNGKH